MPLVKYYDDAAPFRAGFSDKVTNFANDAVPLMKKGVWVSEDIKPEHTKGAVVAVSPPGNMPAITHTFHNDTARLFNRAASCARRSEYRPYFNRNGWLARTSEDIYHEWLVNTLYKVDGFSRVSIVTITHLCKIMTSRNITSSAYMPPFRLFGNIDLKRPKHMPALFDGGFNMMALFDLYLCPPNTHYLDSNVFTLVEVLRKLPAPEPRADMTKSRDKAEALASIDPNNPGIEAWLKSKGGRLPTKKLTTTEEWVNYFDKVFGKRKKVVIKPTIDDKLMMLKRAPVPRWKDGREKVLSHAMRKHKENNLPLPIYADNTRVAKKIEYEFHGMDINIPVAIVKDGTSEEIMEFIRKAMIDDVTLEYGLEGGYQRFVVEEGYLKSLASAAIKKFEARKMAKKKHIAATKIYTTT